MELKLLRNLQKTLNPQSHQTPRIAEPLLKSTQLRQKGKWGLGFKI